MTRLSKIVSIRIFSHQRRPNGWASGGDRSQKNSLLGATHGFRPHKISDLYLVVRSGIEKGQKLHFIILP